MVNEITINRLETALSEAIDFSGTKEQTKIVSNLEVLNATPTGLTDYITVEDERDGDTILAKTLPGMIYANGDLVNVLFIEGTEPIAFQQASASGGVPFAVDRVYRPDFTATVLTGDNSNDVTLTAGNLILPDDIVHSGDTDTLISMEPDKIVLQTGGLEMLSIIEAATDEVVVNDGQGDINFRVEGDTEENLLFVDAGNDRIGIYTSTPDATFEIEETYTDSTVHAAAIVEQTWSPSSTAGNVFPTVMSLLPTYDTTHTPAGGFLTSFRLFSAVADSGTLSMRNTDLRSSNNGSGTIAIVGDIHIRTAVNNGGGTITDYRAIRIEDQTVATTNYGIFQSGSAVLNFFTGDVRIGSNTAGAKLLVDQSSTTAAVAALHLDQADISEEFIKLVGAAAAATLTQSFVDEGDVTTATRIGWFKINVDDVGNQITDGDYWVPFFSLA